ncbi:MAG: PTS sugar transporter subunit IIA [Sporolactobacillus sp.]
MSNTGIVLVSHGQFANEALKSAEMIVGKQKNVATVSLEFGQNLEDLLNEMEKAEERLDLSDGVIIFCDVYGGTPSNAAATELIKYQDKRKIAAYSGLNMPVMLELFSNRHQTFEKLLPIIEKAFGDSWKRLGNKQTTEKEVGGTL